MPWEIPFIKKREPEYNIASVPVTRETGAEPRQGFPGIPEPVREASFEGVNRRRLAQLFTTFAPFDGFGTNLGMETFGGKLFQPDPSAAYPDGALGVDAPRRVVARPASRTTGV